MVGVTAVVFFKENFTRKGFVDGTLVKWKARKVYLKKSGRGILMKTGALRRSIRIIQASANKVTVGTMLVYAQIHNEGGTIIQKPTFKQRIYFSYLSDEAFAAGNKSRQYVCRHEHRQKTNHRHPPTPVHRQQRRVKQKNSPTNHSKTNRNTIS